MVLLVSVVEKVAIVISYVERYIIYMKQAYVNEVYIQASSKVNLQDNKETL